MFINFHIQENGEQMIFQENILKQMLTIISIVIFLTGCNKDAKTDKSDVDQPIPTVTENENPDCVEFVALWSAADIAQDVVPNTSSFKPRVWGGTMLNERGPIVKGVNHPILGQSTARPNRFNRLYKGGGIAKRGKGAAYKSGGRVTGIAKRGFGRALMKGKK